MNTVEKEVSEAEVTIAGMTLLPASVTLVHEGQDGNTVKRSFVQQVPVPDAGLAARAFSELHPGDRVYVTVVNEWREEGCDTYLLDFRKNTEVNHAEPRTKNGANGFVHSEVPQAVVQPKQAVNA